MSPVNKTWDDEPQKSDSEYVSDFKLRQRSLKVISDGFKAIIEQLEKFDPIAAELDLDASPYEAQRKRITQILERAEKDIESADGEWDFIYFGNLSYGTLRYFKAAILYRIVKLEETRDSLIAKYGIIPQALLQSFQEKIQQLDNLAEIPGLTKLKPIDLFFDIMELNTVTTPHPVLSVTHPDSRTKYLVVPAIQSIPILDDELRKRCLNLLGIADMEGQPENQLDTVVREMSAILENRIKQVADLVGKTDKSGDPLVSEVFKADDPILKISPIENVQRSALLLFKGFFGFVRNDVMHNIVPNYTKERVLQLLGYTDYLLSIVHGSQKVK